MNLLRSFLVAVALAASTLVASAQNPEFDFYPVFRRWARQVQSADPVSSDVLLERYREKLTSEGVGAPEIDRRLTLIRSKREALEADFWNRFFTAPTPGFNTEPNEFLTVVVEKRKPGRALDVGMGSGRNALYLAKLGWDVTGFDPAEKAVALAGERAKALGVKITTAVAMDSTFDYGRDRWDLILYSWVVPTEPQKIIDSLKPGGIVLFEGSTTWIPDNRILDMFKPLRVLKYTNARVRSDFFNREEMSVMRFLGEKK